MHTKNDLRSIVLANRKNLTDQRKKEAKLSVLFELIKNKHFQKAKTVGIYYPLASEIDTLDLLKMFPNKTFAFPKVIGSEMIFIKYEKTSEFIKSSFNVYEINEGIDISNQLDICIVPALARNKNNYRLGFGKGYYDKFFKKHSNSYKIGIIYKNENLDFLIEAHDIALNSYILG